MGEHQISTSNLTDTSRLFMRALLSDLHALEQMLGQNIWDTSVRRLGAEQEMFLINHQMRPVNAAIQVLEQARDSRLTTEIAQFNLEANLTPLVLSGTCFTDLESEITILVNKARAAAQQVGADVLLTGILPTLRPSDLTLENITPNPRYYELNRVISSMRDGSFYIHIKGLDEIRLTHDNVLMEACNTSFQVHFQVAPAEFALYYNLAQLITGPVLAAAVNSPLLFGQRLWHETRLALFQHSVDARSGGSLARNAPRRVQFGDNWLQDSILEIFREDVARFPVILTNEPQKENAEEVLARGEIPSLAHLRLHNGTVWRWNRPCYGVADGRAHLRIENRVLPSGPTIMDEVANASFFIGLLCALPKEYGDVRGRIPFDDAKENFFTAARQGLQARFRWLDGQSYVAQELILEQLLPLALKGLRGQSVAEEDCGRYLGLLRDRVLSGQTGAQWTLQSFSAMGRQMPRENKQQALTAAMLAHQQRGLPAHTWPVMKESETTVAENANPHTVGQFMTTDLFTLRPDDLVDLAANLMEWKHIRHIPVEDETGHLTGLLTHRDLLRLLARGQPQNGPSPIAVREIMKTNPVTVAPDTSTLEAMRLMREKKVGCLPVIERGYLIGIVTAYDFLAVSANLLETHLSQ